MRRFARRIRLLDLTTALPLLGALALAAQLLLPLWHALELSDGSAQTAATCTVVCDEVIEDDCCPDESSTGEQPTEREHDPSTCPTCLQIFFAKTFGTPTLVPATEIVDAGDWRRELALEAQVQRLDHPLQLSARAPPSC